MPPSELPPLRDSFGATNIYSAAGFLLQAQDTGHLLALRHVKGNTWGISGGRLNPGETPEDGARRELQEETGYTGPLLNLRALRVSVSQTKNGLLHYHTFFAQVERQFTPVLDSKEHRDSKWVKGLSAWPYPPREGMSFLSYLLKSGLIPELTAPTIQSLTL